ncbi:MAG: hypothetical protein ABSB15_04815 [Bryobacteraceae bacterium]
MTEKVYRVRFKPPEKSTQPVIAAAAEVVDDYLVMLKAGGELAAMFAMDVVESWSEEDSTDEPRSA